MQFANKIFGDKYNDVQFLNSLTEEYPYFTLAHLSLLQQTQRNDRDFSSKMAKTALHFNNPYLLKYRLEHPAEQGKLTEIIIKHENKPEPQATAATEQPLFEPLYTSDYFASQGIKLSEEIKTDDKLGKQLKSFTDWLKTMKKVHAVKTDAIVLDSTVEKLAEKSNIEGEVITESMAEVYESQGKYQKAREVYAKLSLLYPAKSAFFAAKSEQLKEK